MTGTADFNVRNRSSEDNEPEGARGSRWYYVYILLAGFNLLAICLSL